LIELKSELKVRSSVVASPRNCLSESTSLNLGQDSISKLLELQRVSKTKIENLQAKTKIAKENLIAKDV